MRQSNSSQFRKLYRYEDENVEEEWMGRLWVAAAECNYQEVDRQLKEQFIHGLNDKCMLEEIIKELTATKWANRVEAQRAQAVVLNTLVESREFNKIKLSNRARTLMHQSTQ